ncbi:MAG: hypothetical protein AB7F89_19590 [Pirellulaceae bacterium]
MTVNFPAICPNGHVFPSGIGTRNSRNSTISGGQATCPKCGKDGRVFEGMVDVDGDVVTVRKATERNVELLRKGGINVIDGRGS